MFQGDCRDAGLRGLLREKEVAGLLFGGFGSDRFALSVRILVWGCTYTFLSWCVSYCIQDLVISFQERKGQRVRGD